MTELVSVKGTTGHIYRLRLVTRAMDLPEVPGIYSYALPLRYPGAPLESVYLGRARFALKDEVLQDDLRAPAMEMGASVIAYLPVDMPIARRRIYKDLIGVLPDRLIAGTAVEPPPPRTRRSFYAAR